MDERVTEATIYIQTNTPNLCDRHVLNTRPHHIITFPFPTWCLQGSSDLTLLVPLLLLKEAEGTGCYAPAINIERDTGVPGAGVPRAGAGESAIHAGLGRHPIDFAALPCWDSDVVRLGLRGRRRIGVRVAEGDLCLDDLEEVRADGIADTKAVGRAHGNTRRPRDRAVITARRALEARADNLLWATRFECASRRDESAVALPQTAGLGC
jgi:hypothetical protein